VSSSGYLYLHGYASSPASRKAQYFRSRFGEYGVELQIPALDGGNFPGLTLTGQLEAVARYLDSPAVIIGSSMGGYLAALLAARHPDLVKRILLLAPAFRFAHRWKERMGAEAVAEWRRTGRFAQYHYGLKQESWIGPQLIDDGELYEDYPEVTQPALIFHGQRDDVVPLEDSIEFQARRPNVRLQVFDSDHELGDVLDAMWTQAAGFLLREN
jgi:pimeloyl-ACP methyl ester carboxylesterase